MSVCVLSFIGRSQYFINFRLLIVFTVTKRNCFLFYSVMQRPVSVMANKYNFVSFQIIYSRSSWPLFSFKSFSLVSICINEIQICFPSKLSVRFPLHSVFHSVPFSVPRFSNTLAGYCDVSICVKSSREGRKATNKQINTSFFLNVMYFTHRALSTI